MEKPVGTQWKTERNRSEEVARHATLVQGHEPCPKFAGGNGREGLHSLPNSIQHLHSAGYHDFTFVWAVGFDQETDLFLRAPSSSSSVGTPPHKEQED